MVRTELSASPEAPFICLMFNWRLIDMVGKDRCDVINSVITSDGLLNSFDVNHHLADHVLTLICATIRTESLNRDFVCLWLDCLCVTTQMWFTRNDQYIEVREQSETSSHESNCSNGMCVGCCDWRLHITNCHLFCSHLFHRILENC